MKLSQWAKQKGLTYKTAHRMFQKGQLPVTSEQLPTGTILVYPEQPEAQQCNVALYARVSSSDQKEDLQRQLQRLRDYAASQGFRVVKEVSEVGSGLNGHRKKIHALLKDSSLSMIVVEHRDRLARFGVPLLESALASSGRQICVIHDTEYKDDLVQDFVDVVTSMCAGIYGKRSAKNKAKKALEAIQDDDHQRL
jgi:predicted site-specific integrase-resolvase